jgi:hypothetical protein
MDSLDPHVSLPPFFSFLRMNVGVISKGKPPAALAWDFSLGGTNGDGLLAMRLTPASPQIRALPRKSGLAAACLPTRPLP